jgi:glycosyltransferase involved in cell wall biosynthesis
MSAHPFVSVVTPTYNRNRFVKSMVACYKAQEYPKDRMEWIVLDDGTQPIEVEFLALTKDLPNIRYIRLPQKELIGKKRNILNKEAKGEIIISMDDDDFYPPERVKHVVTKFAQTPIVDLAGSSILYMYYSSVDKIIQLGPYGKYHCTNGTLAVRSRYAKTHFYDETVTHAEEASFLQEYKNPLIQLDPKKVMLVMSHSENTFSKERFLTAIEKEPDNPFVKKTAFKLKDFVKDTKLREFYRTA